MRYTHLDGFGLNETGPTSQNLGVANQSLDSLQPYVGVTLPIGKTANAYVRYDALLHTGNVTAQSLQAGVNYRF